MNYNADGLLWIKGSGLRFQSPSTVSMVQPTFGWAYSWLRP